MLIERAIRLGRKMRQHGMESQEGLHVFLSGRPLQRINSAKIEFLEFTITGSSILILHSHLADPFEFLYFFFFLIFTKNSPNHNLSFFPKVFENPVNFWKRFLHFSFPPDF